MFKINWAYLISIVFQLYTILSLAYCTQSIVSASTSIAFVLFSGYLKSLNSIFWNFNVHDYLCITNVIISQHADVYIYEKYELSVTSKEIEVELYAWNEACFSVFASLGP